MRPLTEVKPIDLIPGKQYLIEYVGPNIISKSKFKATFIKNKLPKYYYQSIMSEFKDIIYNQKLDKIQFKLQDCYYKYYEADALIRFYTNKVLQNITGDPNFTIETL